MNLGEETASRSSKSARRERRRKSADAQLELYRRSKARANWNSYDSPQGIILQNVLKREKQERSQSWLANIFGVDENEPLFDPSDDEMEEMLSQQAAHNNKKSRKALQRSNDGLKETVDNLETTINEMTKSRNLQIETYQKVIMRLQRENIELNLKVEELENPAGPKGVYPDRKQEARNSSLSISPSLRHTMSAWYELENKRSAPMHVF